MEYTPGLWMFLSSAMILTTIILMQWQRWTIPLGRAFLLLMGNMLIWTGFFVLETSAQTKELKLLFARVQFIGIAYLPIAWLYVVTSYLHLRKKWWTWMLACLLPTLTVLFATLIPHPNLFWGNPVMVMGEGNFPVMDYDYGIWFFAFHAPYSYLSSLLALGLLIQAIPRMQAVFRRQIVLLIVAFLLPLCTDVMYIIGLSIPAYYNYTTAVFSLSGMLLSWVLFRYRFLDLIPTARDMVIENMEDALILLDTKNRIVDINPAAIRITGIRQQDIGRSIGDFPQGVLAHIMDELQNKEGQVHTASMVLEDGSERMFDIRLTKIQERKQFVSGTILTLHDSTDRTRLITELNYLAGHDELTGVYNRRQLLKQGELLLRNCLAPPSQPFSLCIFDIDGFKAINDTYGHEAGDHTLRSIINQIARQLKPQEVLGRIGGDEFLVLMPSTTLNEAVGRAEFFKFSISSLEYDFQGKGIGLSVSLGVSSTQRIPGDPSLTTVLAMADKALYRAKNLGRNQVAIG